MAEPALWCEARCAGMYDESPVGCQETSTGEFGVKAAIKKARRAGWGVRKGEWFCPVCLRRRGGRRDDMRAGHPPLGIASHRAAHRCRRENCTIQYSDGRRTLHRYGDDMLDDIAQEIHARGGSAEIINAVHACREGHPLNTGSPFANLRFMLAGRGLVTGEQSIWIARQAQKESIWIARQAQKEIAGRSAKHGG